MAIAALLVVGAVASVATTVILAAGIASALRRSPTAPWVLARASGLTAYLLLVSLVLLGLWMAHPGPHGGRRPRPRPRTAIALHSSLSAFTLAFTTLHVVVLVTDPYAGVGWRGLLIPGASQYRPVGVTLGVVALWSLVLTAGTAALAGRVLGRLWWPIHRVAAVAFVLVWAHGFASGTDTPSLAVLYVATGAVVQLVALSRYTARAPRSPIASAIPPGRPRTMIAGRPR